MIAKIVAGAVVATTTLLCGVAIAISNAGDPRIARTEVLRSSLDGMDGKEAVIYVADFKPGAGSGKYTHYGDEFVYVLGGELILQSAGKDPVRLKTGEVGHLARNEIHSTRNARTDLPSKALVVLVVDKNKRLNETAGPP